MRSITYPADPHVDCEHTFEDGECTACFAECEHGDTDDYCCLDCGKELLEDRMAAAYDHAKARRQDGE